MEPELIVKLRQPASAARMAADPVPPGVVARPFGSFHDLLVEESLVAAPLRQTSVFMAATMARLGAGAQRRVDRYWQVPAPPERLDALLPRFAALPEVEAVVVLPAPEAPATPDFSAEQRYRLAAPGGLDVSHAWGQPGGRGSGIRVIDIEGAWQLDHEDLVGAVSPSISLLADAAANWGGLQDILTQHGTAVLGQMAARDNGFGVTGIAPDATYGVVSHLHRNFWGSPIGPVGAIARATDFLQAGDIMLLEMHMPGPRFGFRPMAGQEGYICVEWWEPIFDAIRDATDKGIIVVQAAGNGRENLDDSIYDVNCAFFSDSWRNPLRRADPESDSGAILVGAGAPASGHAGLPRSRLPFSNFGDAVDCQGWGAEVVTTGYGDLLDEGPHRTYTGRLGGTSAAAPMVAATLACVQGVLRAKGMPLLTPARARALLRGTGSAQQWSQGQTMRGDRIGNLPDIKALVAAATAPAEVQLAA
ncbi:S8 family serine peptidase [Falsiroseomonas sp. HW251]|uniref:S8 family serine peptidase n=1 Tax=Falsiroseomonas sp. HW251 TaxID=3390998 RepID=UPI003D31FEAD